MPSKSPDPGSAARHADPADAFEVWLSHDLHRLYSAIVAEPIPQELLRLVDGLSDGTEARAVGPPPRERGTDIPCRQNGFEQRIRERAYFLWLDGGRPRGRAAEHWRLATVLQAAHEAGAALHG